MNLKKTSVLVLFFMCSFPLAVFSDNQRPQTPTLEGDWTGGFKMGERWTTYKVHFTAVNGVIKGTCELPSEIVQAEGAKTVDLANVALKGDRVHFDIPNKEGTVIFDGAFKDGELPGSFKRGTASGEAHLARIVLLKPEVWAGYIGEYENDRNNYVSVFKFSQQAEDGSIFIMTPRPDAWAASVRFPKRLSFAGLRSAAIFRSTPGQDSRKIVREISKS